MPKFIKDLLPMMGVCLFAGIVLSILAPFGTHQFKTPYRFAYWVGLCLAGGFGAAAADLGAHLFKKKFTPWQSMLGQSITATLAVFAVITFMNYRISGQFPNLQNALLILFYISVITITIASIGALMAKKSGGGETASSRAALYERLAPKLRSAEIYALAAEDHYVRVITSKGDELVLMRLSDAIRETAPLKGLSPHRSWWVAEGGAQKVGKSEITLHTGQTVPISRSGMKLVRAAGWT